MLYPYLNNPERNHNHAEWHVSFNSHKCDSCRKYHHVYFYQESFFATLDGGDSLDYTECLHCIIKQKIKSIPRKVKKAIKRHADALAIVKCVPLSKRFEVYGKLIKIK